MQQPPAPPFPFRPRISPAAALWGMVGLGLLFAAMRVVGTLGPAAWRALLPLSFVLMVITPWVLLSKDGRAQIGLKAPSRPLISYGWALAYGISAATACFLLGLALFGTTADNWFVSVAASYQRAMNTTGFSLPMLHLAFTLPAALFSPIGEEIFFRGLLQRTLEMRLSERASTAWECGAFGVVHLCHHGLFWGSTGLGVHVLSGAIWVGLMAATAWGFAVIRKRSGSVFPAVVAHAAFNVGMNVGIFGALWV